MSSISYGTGVPHVAPKSRLGGPLALVRDGDPSGSMRHTEAENPSNVDHAPVQETRW